MKRYKNDEEEDGKRVMKKKWERKQKKERN